MTPSPLPQTPVQRGGAEREATAPCVPFRMGKTTGHISFAPPTQFIRAGNRVWYFDWHHYFGPSHTNKDGHPYAKQPGPKSIFWHAVSCWHEQGCRIAADGSALWDDVRENMGPIRLRHVGGRHWQIVEDSQ